MASTVKRRPLPALVALLALLLLTSLVWWRVLNRSGGSTHTAKPCPVVTPSVRLPAPESLTVAVLNGTTKTGIAGRARTTLIADGFNVPRLASNVPKKRVNKIKLPAEIQYGPAARQGALLLRYYFPGASMVATKSKSKTITVSLGTKYRAVASARAVTAALARDKTVAGTPSATPSPVITC
jgi:hypothetical protein